MACSNYPGRFERVSLRKVNRGLLHGKDLGKCAILRIFAVDALRRTAHCMGSEVKIRNSNIIMKDVIIRTRSAGVFAGLLKSFENQTAVLIEARRLWYWSGAASLSQLSVDGVKNPSACKFPVVVPEVTLPEVIEILPLSKKARASINSVPVWAS